MCVIISIKWKCLGAELLNINHLYVGLIVETQHKNSNLLAAISNPFCQHFPSSSPSSRKIERFGIIYMIIMLTFILSMFSIASVIAVPTRKTDFFLFQRVKTWNEAFCICKYLNMSFLEVNTQEKAELFKATMNTAGISYSEFWFGLFNSGRNGYSTRYVYTWSEGGILGSWSTWTSGEPNSESTDKCVRSTIVGWRTMGCQKTYQFVCEKTSELCSMKAEMYTNKQAPHSFRSFNTETECVDYCLFDITEGCYGVVFMAPDSCAVYTSKEKQNYIHNSTETLNAARIFHRKICFEGFTDNSQFIYTDESSDPQLNCRVVTRPTPSTNPASPSESSSPASTSASSSPASPSASSTPASPSASTLSSSPSASSSSFWSSSSFITMSPPAWLISSSESLMSISPTPSTSLSSVSSSLSPASSSSIFLSSSRSSVISLSSLNLSAMSSTSSFSHPSSISGFLLNSSTIIYSLSSVETALRPNSSFTSISSRFPRIDPESSILCGCKCQPSPIQMEQQQEELAKVVQELKVVKNATSKFRRKMISIEDNRPSANALGAAGVVIFAFVGAFILLPDLISIVTYIWTHRRRNPSVIQKVTYVKST